MKITKIFIKYNYKKICNRRDVLPKKYKNSTIYYQRIRLSFFIHKNGVLNLIKINYLNKYIF